MLITKLKNAASEASNVTTRAIAYRVAKIKLNYGPMPNEVAYGIVAQLVGVDVSKIVSDHLLLEQIRNQIDRIAEKEIDLLKPKPKTIVKNKIIEIAKDIKISDPLLDTQIISDAKQMAIYYAQIYVFENSVREVINRVLSNNLSTKWWNNTNVKKELITKVQERIDNENQNPWHGQRGAHPIYYTDISDLIYLITRHWIYFKDIFPRLEWVTEKLEQISFSRNIVDHHNPLNKRDRDRLIINLQDWQKQINSNQSKI